jgi:transglutaminase-like putative cysteine protease
VLLLISPRRRAAIRVGRQFFASSISIMLIQCGYNICYTFSTPTSMVLMLHLRPELAHRFRSVEKFTLSPNVAHEFFFDAAGNRCVRLIAPAGQLELSGDVLVEDVDSTMPIVAQAREHPIGELPYDTLPYLLPSRYCEVDLLGPLAWSLFAFVPPGWARVQAICDWVFAHLRFDYSLASATRTANQAYEGRVGVCRDFTHLAITLCRCLNIPARYVSGYLGDIGVPVDPAPMDFSACMQVYLGNAWHTFDVRHNARRAGYQIMAIGRDAADVALTTSFGPHVLTRFVVRALQIPANVAVA